MKRENCRGLLEQVLGYSLNYLERAETAPPFPSREAIGRLEALDGPLPREGKEAPAVLELLQTAAEATAVQTGGRYFGFVVGGLLPVAHGAQWLADTWNQNAGLYAMSPAASKLEDICERWLAELLGLEAGTAMGLVTGSANALICALAAARNELFRRQGYDVAVQGMRRAPKLRVVLSEGAHATVFSALSLLGFGREELTLVPMDGAGRLDPSRLPALDESTLLLLQAGNVNGGAFDDFQTLCARAREAGAWVHIDGAFGLWAAASRNQRHLTAGMEAADSWSTDGHKTLNAGYDCGIVLCRSRDALRRAMQAEGSYLPYGRERDGMCYVTEMSRRARAVPLWAVLCGLGARGVEALVDELCGHAAAFARGLQAAGLHLVQPPCFNQFMVRGAGEAETQAILRAVQESGVCWCGASRWAGEAVIRVSVCSWATTGEDIRQSIQAFRRALELVRTV